MWTQPYTVIKWHGNIIITYYASYRTCVITWLNSNWCLSRIFHLIKWHWLSTHFCKQCKNQCAHHICHFFWAIITFWINKKHLWAIRSCGHWKASSCLSRMTRLFTRLIKFIQLIYKQNPLKKFDFHYNTILQVGFISVPLSIGHYPQVWWKKGLNIQQLQDLFSLQFEEMEQNLSLVIVNEELLSKRG